MAKTDLALVAQTELQKQSAFRGRLFCCASTACMSSGCETVMDAVRHAVDMHQLSDVVQIVPTGCMGLCSLGPLVRVEITGQPPVLYKEVEPMLARLIVAEHVAPGVAASLATAAGDSASPDAQAQASAGSAAFTVPPFLADNTLSLDLPFFKRQTRVVLANSGHINPEAIEQYIARGGYEQLRRILNEMTPEQVIEQITASGLRGRGGGGYSTGLKWSFGRKAKADEKFIICNGDEGDPGAYMDRSVLEGDPHAVIEGMLIAAYATGAASGWFYIRAEYPLAVERVEVAIRQCRKFGLLGKDILGSGFEFNAEIRLGAGAFVCGEETALINSIEGRRGVPRSRPPYPSVSGLWGKPTCVNNVETLANVPTIFRRGPEWFASMGTATSKGTKVFALTGKVLHSGLIEVPMGTTVRDIVELMGGGSSSGKPLKAVQSGGPSGGVIPYELLEVPVCYEELRKLGSMMGSGGMIVMDQGDSMVEIAKFYLGFTVDESCGKCAPCRIGGPQMLNLLQKVLDGRAMRHDLAEMRRLALAMQKASLCGLGQTAANPVVSTLRYFENEYLDLITGSGLAKT